MKMPSVPPSNLLEGLETRTLFSSPAFSHSTAHLSIARTVSGVAFGDKAIFAGGHGELAAVLFRAVDIYHAGDGLTVGPPLPLGDIGIGYAAGRKIVYVGANTQTFDPATATWRSTPTPGFDGNGYLPVSAGRFLVALGNPLPQSRYDLLEIMFDTRSGRWKTSRWKTNGIRGVKFSGDKVTVGDTAYFSGYTPSAPSNRLVTFNGKTGKWAVQTLPISAGVSVIGSVGNSLLLQSGSGLPGMPFIVDVISVFNNATRTVVQHPLSQPRGEFSTATVGTKVYLISGKYVDGSGNVQQSSAVDVYDNATEAWSVLTCPTTIPLHSKVGVVGTKLLFQTGDVFDTSDNVWSTTIPLRSSADAGGASPTSIGTQVLYAGGLTLGSPEGQRIPDDTVDIYTDLSPSPVLSGTVAGGVGHRDKVSVCNTGDAPLPAGYTVQLYASPDRMLGGTILVGSRKVSSSLAAGGSSPFSIRTLMPKDMPAGNYHLLAAVQDSSGNITPIAAEDEVFSVRGSHITRADWHPQKHA